MSEMSHCSICGDDGAAFGFSRKRQDATVPTEANSKERVAMKKLLAAMAVATAVATPVAAQDGLNFGALGANGPLVAAAVTGLLIVVVGADNANNSSTTTTTN
jgi:TPP-dependent indolepyruvate ferredoxin oxidoreductase alpha subunit